MASIDVLILSSSPPRPFAAYNMHSSSPLPSLSELAQNKPKSLRTGSRAAPISQNASASFASAASLCKAASSRDLLCVDAIQSFKMDTGNDGSSAEELPKLLKAKARKSMTKRIDDGKDKVAKALRKTAITKDKVDGVIKPKKPRKPRVKPVDEDPRDDQTAQDPGLRKPRMKKAGKETTTDETSKEKPTRKGKAKKLDGETQTQLSKGQVTKSSSKSTSDEAKKGLQSKKSEPAMTDSVDPFADSLDYGLVGASKRRTDWTPPMPAGKVSDLTPASANLLEYGLTSGGSLQAGERTKGFKDLFGSFGFTKLDTKAVEKKPSEVEGPRKRKLIELVKTSVSAAAAAPPKEKESKKKARTITDLATSAYAEEELPAKPAPLLQYFSYHTEEQGTNTVFKVPPKPRSKSPVKGSRKAKKGSAQAPILLSPESALKQSVHQDFVFGTSSQLAREDSPTLLRDLHEAMQASNEVGEDDPFADSINETMVIANRSKAKPSSKRNLWSAASRDVAGELLEVELVDLAESPAITRQLRAVVVPQTRGLSGSQGDNDVWHNIEGVSENLSLTDPASGDFREGSGELSQKFSHLTEANDRYYEEVKAGVRDAMEKKSSPKNSGIARENESIFKPAKPLSKSSAKLAKPTDLQMPDFSSYTTDQLAKQIAAYRFKPVKNRDQMITLLEKCWEGKNRIALGALGTNIIATAPLELSKSAAPASSQITAFSAKRPRGRPRKSSETLLPPKPAIKAALGRPKASNTAEGLEIDSDTPLSHIQTPKKSKKRLKEPAEEISDSDTQVTPSPPRRNASQLKTPPLPLKLSTSVDVDTSPELSPASSQRLLFTHISRAVRSQPPSKDPSLPSWHEKILLYDPIILEDLTVWLNTGPLEKVGWDGEVEPKQVKKWCESKSICCLWKENLRGGTRSRY